MKMLLNRILFFWYYRLVDDHFKQYPIIKSIKLLRQHYDHEYEYNKQLRGVIQTGINEVEEWKAKYLNLKMQIIANPGTIDKLNDMFGTDFTNQKDN